LSVEPWVFRPREHGFCRAPHDRPCCRPARIAVQPAHGPNAPGTQHLGSEGVEPRHDRRGKRGFSRHSRLAGDRERSFTARRSSNCRMPRLVLDCRQ
jgi:hypothetical protein